MSRHPFCLQTPIPLSGSPRFERNNINGLQVFDENNNLWFKIGLEEGPYGLIRSTGLAMLDSLSQTLVLYGRKDVGSDISLSTGWGTAGNTATRIMLTHSGQQIQFFTNNLGRLYLDANGLNLWSIPLRLNNAILVSTDGKVDGLDLSEHNHSGTGQGGTIDHASISGLGTIATHAEGVDGTFTTADSKTVTVSKGIITAIT